MASTSLVPISMPDSSADSTTEPNRPSSDRRSDGLIALARQGLFAVGAVTWSAFWALVARIHLMHGDYLSAGFVGLTFVVPGLVALGWLFGIRPEVGRPTLPDLIGSVTD